MAAQPGINDDFRLEGFWWLPDQPAMRVVGELTFSQKDGPVLTITGTFSPNARAFGSALEDRAVIHGVTKDGQAVSMFDSLHTSRQGGLRGAAVQEVYKGHLLAIGYHFTSAEETIFTESFVSFEDIEEWLGHRFFELRVDEDQLSYTLGIDRSINHPLARVEGTSLSVGSGFSTNGTSTSFTVDASCHIKVRPDDPQSIDWHFSAASKILALASLCTGRHLPLRSLTLDGPHIRYSSEHTRPVQVRIYASMTHPESHKARRFEMPLIYAADITDTADHVFQKWFDCYDELSSGLYLFLTTLADRAMYINARFTLAIQALEVFHRRASPGSIMPKDRYSRVRKALVAAIPDGTPDDMCEKLTSVLAFANEPSLKQRVQALLNELELQLGEAPPGYGEAFVSQVVDTRNYYTHYTPRLESRALAGADMHYAIRRIVLLLIVLLLIRIGVTPATVRDAIGKHREFKQLWESQGNPV